MNITGQNETEMFLVYIMMTIMHLHMIQYPTWKVYLLWTLLPH